MNIFEFIIALMAVVFSAITGWILLLRKEKPAKPAAPRDDCSISELMAMGEAMGERIDILEAILDAEVPEWRTQHAAAAAGKPRPDSQAKGGGGRAAREANGSSQEWNDHENQ